MKALIQRIQWAEVETNNEIVSQIERGLLAYVGISSSDTVDDAKWLANKIAGLRIFEDHNRKLSLSVQDARGGVLAVSNFTLMGNADKGRRPEFTAAAPGEAAERVYQAFLAALADTGCEVESGVFGADMTIRSAADGPVNIMVESPTAGKG